MADRDRCEVCEYKIGEGAIILCGNKIHFGLAMRKEGCCDSFTRRIDSPPGVVKTINVSDKVAGEDF